jgi:hypothetical protein
LRVFEINLLTNIIRTNGSKSEEARENRLKRSFVSLRPTPLTLVMFLGDDIKDDEMDGKYDTHGGEEKL